MKYIFLTLILAFAPVANASIPEFPMSFWGKVYIDGQMAPVGTNVRAYDQLGNLVGQVEVSESGVYGYTEPIKQKLIVGEYENSVTFKFQSPQINSGTESPGLSQVTYSNFESGLTVEKDLMFITKSVTAPSGGGGGGGGGGKTVKQQPKLDLTVAGFISTTTSSSTDQEQRVLLQKQLIALLIKLIELLKLHSV